MQLARLWRRLREQSKAVFVFDVTPYAGDDNDPIHLYDKVADGTLGSTFDISYDAFKASHLATTRRLANAAAHAGATLVDPAMPLCPDGKCPIVRNGRPLYTNGSHLRTSVMKEPRFAVFDRCVLPDHGREARAE